MGETKLTISYFEKALVVAREIGDWMMEEKVLGNFGLAYLETGNEQQAIRYYEQALTLTRRIGNRVRGIGGISKFRSYLQWIGGRGIWQLNTLEQALAIANETGDKYKEGLSLGNLGITYKNLGDLQQAYSYLEKALNILDGTGNTPSLANISYNFIAVLAKQGKRAEMLNYAEHALQAFEHIWDEETARKVHAVIDLARGKQR